MLFPWQQAFDTSKPKGFGGGLLDVIAFKNQQVFDAVMLWALWLDVRVTFADFCSL